MKNRCNWVPLDKEYYVKYHDDEWGVQVTDDAIFFEFLRLEGAQAGLSWDTILKKCEGYRNSFLNFDYKKLSKVSDKFLEEQRENSEIIRNRLKIYSVRTNAIKFIEVQQEFGSFYNYLYSFLPNQKRIVNKRKSIKEVPATSIESDLISKDMKKRGFKFVGSTIIYSFMQATGIVNDHEVGCFRYNISN
ncbi:MAG: DNA-3-methyladenine glycosylase I [Candidatus Dojkabacteria bacterium]|nr:DNA-3-methyladenine glycosylase I [Candidatus Dojkabacteria bacterium]